jgi:hypothetical protein
MRSSHPFRDATKARPTKSHRPALWEGILGAVYAMDDSGEVRYFDYDYEGARTFAGVAEDRDLRLARVTVPRTYGGDPTMSPRKGQFVLWIRKAVV